jgi:GAF domain-containing protein
MRRRSKAGGEAIKKRRHKTSGPNAAQRRGSSSLETDNARLTRELDEAREQQAATSELLKVISSSPGKLESVFGAILKNATRICEARFGTLNLYDGKFFRRVAIHNPTPEFAMRLNEVIRPHPESGYGRVARTRQVVHIDDVRTRPPYLEGDDANVKFVDLTGARTVLAVPMLKGNELIGLIAIFRQEVRPFTDKQIELMKTFAAQAVIAIENTRLLNELRESLQQQTATSEVLKVISSSPGDLEPVFNTMLANAARICEAKIGVLYLRDGDGFRAVATTHDAPPAYVEARKQTGWEKNWPLDGPVRRAATTKQVAHVADISKLQSYQERHPLTVASVELGKFRTVLGVPMLKDDELIGVITMNRQEVRPFTDNQIELIKNFAAQGVIAIENTQLLNELRESLQQQTATADVLKTISRSSFDLQKVLDALVGSAARLCEAFDCGIFLRQDDHLRLEAHYGQIPTEIAELSHSKTNTWPIERGWVTGRAFVDRQPIHIHDLQDCADEFPDGAKMARIVGHRTILAVPLLRDKEAVGAIFIRRMEVKPFTNKQIELLTTFADQAVIAIENVRLFDEVQARTRDLSESLEQQTATSEVLGVISSSPGELKPVFDAMLENAVRICDAKFGTMFRNENGVFHPTAVNAEKEFAEFVWGRGPFQPPPGTPLGRLLRSGEVICTADEAAESNPGSPGRLAGARSLVAVPMLKEKELIGAIVLYRMEVRPFTEKQIELVSNFAKQAVIAIENTRLLDELRESLQQQIATADVLKVISSSPGKLEPVFDAILKNATDICEAGFGQMFLFDQGNVQKVAQINVPEPLIEWDDKHGRHPPVPGGPMERIIRTMQVVHIPDVLAEHRDHPVATLGGARALLGVPMVKEGKLIGALNIFRQEARPFTDKQIELVQNFAAQAVIAIENTRLLNELRESLQQQTATADVLKVISASPGDLGPVFGAILESATGICGAKFGTLFLSQGDTARAVAHFRAPSAFLEAMQRTPVLTLGEGALGRATRTKQAVQIADVRNEPAYVNDPPRLALLESAGMRTILNVPMLKDDEVIGQIAIYRQEVRSFTDKQIELVKNFAAQAVIAIENARLLNELRESLQQQTATADVLKVISRSTFDLQKVLQTLVESAARLCDADSATITRERNGVFYRAEAYGFSREFMDYMKDIPVKPDRGSASGRALLEGRVIHVADVLADPEYTWAEAQRLGNYRTILCVPMLREGIPIGVLILTRTDVRPFTSKQIELISTFADQAAIAIENVRLFESVEARTRELAKSLLDLRTTQDRLVQTQKLASLGQLTAGIAHEIKNPLNFVNNFSAVSSELIDELQGTLKGPLNEKMRAEVSELAETLRGNLDKIVQHGKRADAIVKNMLLHSREGSSEHRLVDINALVEESLNLAYHGARAERQGFNITLERSFDPAAEQADVFPQDITRVLLNLILNGFYAATKRKAKAGDGYEPTLTASTRSLGDRVEIKVRDNGTGIPPDVKEKIFNPFFTTKPAGEGTGLGLSISHDIIVKQHGGSIEVETEPGEYTEFRIILPRAAAFVTTSGAQS